jgi:hypothetical protein
MKLLQRNKPTSLTCVHNIDYDMDWDSDELIFQIFGDKYWKAAYEQGYMTHDLVPEILVYSRKFDFETVYIAREDDFDEVEEF